MRRYSKTILRQKMFEINFMNKTYKVICMQKRCKYIKIKVVDKNTLQVIIPSIPSEEEVYSILNRNSEKIVKLLNVPREEKDESSFIIFGIRYNRCDYSLNQINNMYDEAFKRIEELFRSIEKNNNFPKTNLYFRKMKSRWGVCYPSLKKIGLSSYLVYVPLELIEYVIYHEFCHYKYPDHSKSFYIELSKYCKDHKEKKAKLKFYNSLL